MPTRSIAREYIGRRGNDHRPGSSVTSEYNNSGASVRGESSWNAMVEVAQRSAVLRCPACHRVGHWVRVPKRILQHLATIPESAGLEGAGTDVSIGRRVHAIVGQEWRCGACGFHSREPLVGQLGSIKEHSWRGHGDIGFDVNWVEDEFVLGCDRKLRSWNRDPEVEPYRWERPAFVGGLRGASSGNRMEEWNIPSFEGESPKREWAGMTERDEIALMRESFPGCYWEPSADDSAAADDFFDCPTERTEEMERFVLCSDCELWNDKGRAGRLKLGCYVIGSPRPSTLGCPFGVTK